MQIVSHHVFQLLVVCSAECSSAHIHLFAGQYRLHRFPRYSLIDKFIVQGKLPNPDFLTQFSIC